MNLVSMVKALFDEKDRIDNRISCACQVCPFCGGNSFPDSDFAYDIRSGFYLCRHCKNKMSIKEIKNLKVITFTRIFTSCGYKLIHDNNQGEQNENSI